MKQRKSILIIGAAVLALLLLLLLILPGDRFLAADSDARNLSPGRSWQRISKPINTNTASTTLTTKILR